MKMKTVLVFKQISQHSPPRELGQTLPTTGSDWRWLSFCKLIEFSQLLVHLDAFTRPCQV